MATVVTPRRVMPDVNFDVKAPAWLERIPPRVRVGGLLLLLMAISVVMRTRVLSGQYWMDEALSVGITTSPCETRACGPSGCAARKARICDCWIAGVRIRAWRGGHWHPRDQARRDHHAGEPLVR